MIAIKANLGNTLGARSLRLVSSSLTFQLVFVEGTRFTSPTYEYNWFSQQRYKGRIEKTILCRYFADETFDIGIDTGSPVSDDCKSPNPYTGTLHKVQVHLQPTDYSENDTKTIRKAERAVDKSKATKLFAFLNRLDEQPSLAQMWTLLNRG